MEGLWSYSKNFDSLLELRDLSRRRAPEKRLCLLNGQVLQEGGVKDGDLFLRRAESVSQNVYISVPNYSILTHLNGSVDERAERHVSSVRSSSEFNGKVLVRDGVPEAKVERVNNYDPSESLLVAKHPRLGVARLLSPTGQREVSGLVGVHKLSSLRGPKNM